MTTPIDSKVAFTIEDVTVATGLGRDRIYDAIRTKQLRARKYGRRTLITRSDLTAFLEGLPALELAMAKVTPMRPVAHVRTLTEPEPFKLPSQPKTLSRNRSQVGGAQPGHGKR